MKNTHKAMIITILLTFTVVLMAFNFHIRKKNALVAETYYELLSEDEIIKEKETLEEILKSFDDLNSTNQAFNETRKYDNFEDEEFQETIDKIRNRNTEANDVSDTSEPTKTMTASDNSNMDSYNSVQELIDQQNKNKSSAKNSANANSTMSYSLVDRTLLNNPTPIYLCEEGGKIVISITVDQQGNVTDASYNNASASTNGCLIDHALEYAKAARFDASPGKPSQIGSITFYFKGKQ